MSLGEQLIGAGLGVASDYLGGIMGMSNAKDLQKMQIEGQKELSEYNLNKQMELWNKTNYSQQVEQMRKAGLNVGLMYSKGGPGGTTATVPGSVSGQNVEKRSSALEGMALANATSMNQAQIENIKADTEKKAAEKKEIQSRTPTYAKGMEKTNYEINEIASRTNLNAEQIKNVLQAIEESKSRQDLNIATKNRMETLTPLEAEKISSDITTQKIENILTKAKTNLTNEQTKEVTQNIQNSMAQILINRRNSVTAEKDAATREWESGVRKNLAEKGFDVQTQGQILNFITGLLGIGATATKPGATIINY